ncbi:MAG: DUF4271 domain-containing protein [Prevotella sp.]|nr:DUF4271 domain-containing protein [Prevotella sp.]
MQQDSIIERPQGGIFDSIPQRPSKPQTPYQVLRLLPKDATPAQQDSAIQAWFEPGEIRYSEQPDTLHLPGHGIPRDLKAVDIPQFYRENYFSNDSLYHPELDGGRYGIAGDPIPYSIKNDDLITSLLILVFVIITYAFSHYSSFIIKQCKYFLYNQREESNSETGTEIRLQMVFVLLTCLMYTILYYFYAKTWIADTYALSSEYSLLGIFGCVIVVYFILKFLLYTAVNHLFFDDKSNKKFLTYFLLITAFEGVALFPIVLLVSFFSLSPQNAAYYCSFVVILVKLLIFYKSYDIFFKQKGVFFQIILYFCALEIVPLAILWGGLASIAELLKINF